ncbi:MAG: low molecular weight protein-tyrosine-phosphatase [Myxococcota bacterium]|nr:low molecular weight protein-tyrosine-phosphatase [Myxococcota bacterium]MEC9389265.1 low molecular weight protein-tyrosine-phosphatase [Myxococcota bacterium]
MATRVLMVCLGNICRSPLAEGAFQHRVDEGGHTHDFVVDSAGTSAWHVGEHPHAGSIAVAADHGLDIRAQRSRQVTAAELHSWDWIIAMDESNLRALLHMGAPPQRTRLLLSLNPSASVRDVPDPYYEGGFDRVFTLIDDACGHLLDFLTRDDA